MTINDIYGKYEIVFSRSASDLRVSDAGTSVVPVSVMVDTEEVAAFSVMPYNKEIVLNLSGILEACAAGNLPGLSSAYIVRNVKITVGGQKWEHLVLFGVKPAKLSVDKYDILTRRPARVMTFRDSVEYVSLKWEFYASQGTGSELLAEIYFMTHLPVQVTLPGPALLTARTGMARIDCSYSAVSAAASSAGYGDEVILGWKVWARDVKLSTSGPAVETLGAPQEFYLLPSRRHCSYLFRNCYGFFDTIHATGPKSLSSDGEVSTFINNGLESELDNSARLYFEQSTGYIATRDEASFWMDFMRSSERYVIESGTAKKIIIDEGDAKTTIEELSSFKFKWHYADRNNDYNI